MLKIQLYECLQKWTDELGLYLYMISYTVKFVYTISHEVSEFKAYIKYLSKKPYISHVKIDHMR